MQLQINTISIRLISGMVQAFVLFFLAGLLLSVAYLKTRLLWLPTGLHMAWNWTQSGFWGMGVSGYHVKWSLFYAEPQGSDLLSGGAFGPEASIIATVLITGLIVWLWKTSLIKPSTYILDLWQKYPSGYGVPPVDDEMTEAWLLVSRRELHLDLSGQ